MARWPFQRHHSYGPLSIDSTVDEDLQPQRKCACHSSSTCLTITAILWLILMLGTSVGLSIFLVLQADLVIDKSIREFSIPNHETSRRAQALELAMRAYSQPGFHLVTKRSVDEPLKYPSLRDGNETTKTKDKSNKRHRYWHLPHISRRSPYSEYGITQRVLRWKLQLAFIAIGDEPNILTRERLQTIHGIEDAIRNHPDYKKFCWRDFSASVKDPTIDRQYGGCSPINSLLTYFYPTMGPNGQVYYNGLGRALIDIDSALDLAMSHDSFYYYVGDQFNRTNKSGVLMHSEVFFGAPINGYMDVIDRPEEQNQKFSEFITSYISLLRKVSTEKVQVLYGGNEIYDYEVNQSFWWDMRLATVALATIGVLMFVLTSFSAWLTVCGLWSIVFSFPLALTLYRVVFGVRALGILNGAAAFVIVGIGVDDVFVFINTFRHHSNEASLGRRLRVTLTTAGRATFFTSFTTSAAFAANVASSIPAVHNFGLFMSLIVACCWLTVLIIMTPALVLWATGFVNCEQKCYNGCDTCQGPLVLPDEMAQFVLQNASNSVTSPGGHSNGSHGNQEDDDDEDAQLLCMDAVATTDSGMWVDLDDDPLLVLENQLQQSMQSTDGCSLIGRMQIMLYEWLVVPIVKARWIIIGAFVAMLIVCAGLITQLRVADKPPQFFKPESNLQKFYDLKANLSIDLLECYQCAALYEMAKKRTRQSQSYVTTQPPASPLSTTHVTSTLTTPFYDVTTSATPIGRRQDVTTSVVATAPPRMMREATTVGGTMSRATSKEAAAAARQESRSPLTTEPNTAARDTPKSVPSDFKPCGENGQNCDEKATIPVTKSTAAVYVVFGIKDLDTSSVDVNHVVSGEGEVVYDEDFEKAFNFSMGNLNVDALKQLCQLCKTIGAYEKLVETNSAQCLPKEMPPEIEILLESLAECRDLPRNRIVFERELPVRSVLMFSSTGLKWIAFAFQSKTVQSDSYFDGYADYQKWETFIKEIKKNMTDDSPLKSIYQISPFWKQVFMEVIGVSSAVYSLVLSLGICVVAVSVFTGHILLLIVVMLSIFGMIMTVVAMFYVVGWQLGAVEAISLSILVGSSVDYCVHLVEGYLQAGVNPPFHLSLKRAALRQWRTRNALTRIGLSIISSALTTFMAALPLTQTNIQPFAQFGRIVAICTLVSILYTLTVCCAFLATFAPSHFKSSWRSTLVSVLATGLAVALVVLVLYLITLFGVNVPGPNGKSLFG